MSIQDLISKFKKELSHKVVVNEDIERLPTGLDIIDIATGGGLPAGGFALFTGSSGVGKTLLALNMISSMMKKYPESICVVIDAETSLTVDRLRQLGIDDSRVLLIRRVTLEDVFENIVPKFLEFKAERKETAEVPSIILWDSIASTPTEKETSVVRIEEALGLKARIMSSKLPILCQKLEKSKTCMIAINQLREQIVINPYDRKEDIVKGLDGTMPGGAAQYYQASILMRVKNAGQFNTTGVEVHKSSLAQTKDMTFNNLESGFIGYKMELHFIKNKFAVKRPIPIIVDPSTGINSFYTAVNFLIDFKYLVTAGGWYQIKDYAKKFRMKEIEKLYKEDEEFRNKFNTYYTEILENIKKQLRTNVQEEILQNIEVDPNTVNEELASNAEVNLHSSYQITDEVQENIEQASNSEITINNNSNNEA